MPNLCLRLLPFVLPLSLSAQALRDPLLGSVRTPDGTAVAGVVVEAWRAEGRGTCLLDLDYKNDFHRVEVARTSVDGRFAMHLPVGLSCRIVVDHAPFAVWRRDDCVPGDDLTVQLAEPCIVEGTLTLADGTPAMASVRAWNPLTSDEVFRGRTDERGHYRFDRVEPGKLRIEVAPDRAPAPAWHDTAVAAGESHTYDLQLERGVPLRGRVTDGDGKPIAGARIGEGWTLFRAVTTDRDGGYELPGFGSSGRSDVHCVADGFVRRVIDAVLPHGDAVTLDFELARGTAVSGRVVDRGGLPLANVYVQAFGRRLARQLANGRFALPSFDLAAGRTDTNGRFRLGGLDADLAHVLVVRKDGCAMLVHTLPHADGEGVAAVGDVVLPEARCVRGVVVDRDGKPLANVRVELVGYNADRDSIAARAGQAVAPKWNLLQMYVGTRRSRTDQLGRFAFGDVPAGTFEVGVLDPDLQAIGSSGQFDVAADRDPPPIPVTKTR